MYVCMYEEYLVYEICEAAKRFELIHIKQQCGHYETHPLVHTYIQYIHTYVCIIMEVRLRTYYLIPERIRYVGRSRHSIAALAPTQCASDHCRGKNLQTYIHTYIYYIHTYIHTVHTHCLYIKYKKLMHAYIQIQIYIHTCLLK